eukprot:CAMPEP_0170287802 /NCGR_PEP_ID=MMETSP0116_2-20130129/43958_1 /TAXON_ID=400756 /ORGANISM="Durinskia baltica, Strain CSIRO CS-38" /LENGTH=218 /DNA_ID=CAMNT_0010539219 /DNA_START=138 /DNA_END=790 /DNA_ORIENTATION=+
MSCRGLPSAAFPSLCHTTFVGSTPRRARPLASGTTSWLRSNRTAREPLRRPRWAVGPLEQGVASAAAGYQWFAMPPSLQPPRNLAHALCAAGFFVGVACDEDAEVRALLALGSPARSCILAVNLARLLGIQPAPEGHRVEFEVPDEISGAAVLDLVQEEGLLRRVPMRVFVVDLCVRTTDVRPYQRHRDRLPVRRLALGQALQRLAADALGVLEELLR